MSQPPYPNPYAQPPPPGGSPPPQPPPRRHSTAKIIFGVIGGIIGLFVIIGVASGGRSNTSPSSGPAAATAGSSAPLSSPSPPAPPSSPSPPAPASSPLPASQQQALTAAQNYLSGGQGFSRAGLIAQLDSPYGGKFSVADATWAADNSGADWNAQAVISAKNYASDGQGFSHQGLIDQLTSPYGGQFTSAQAAYGVSQAGL